MTPTKQPEAQQQFSDEQLFAYLHDTVQKLLEQHVDDESNFEKLLQFMRLRKADYYYRGIQYIAPELSSTGVIDYVPVGTPPTPGDSATWRNVLDYNIDQIKTYGRKFIATLGQRPFYNVKAVANDPQSENDRRAAREADKGVQILRGWWNVKVKNLEMAYHAWKSGTIFPYVRWVVDGNKYGWSEEPVFGEKNIVVEPGGFLCRQCGAKSPELATQETLDDDGTPIDFTVCPNCHRPLDGGSYQEPVEAPVPYDTGEVKRYENGRVELHLLSGFFITTTFSGKDLADLPFVDYECEEYPAKLVGLYPQLRAKLKNGELQIEDGGGPMRQTGMLARESAQSQIGLSRQQNKRTVGYKRTWIRPFIFELVEDEQKRNALKQYFPEGLKAARVGKQVVALAHEKIDDYFNTVYPEVGEYVFRDGISWGLLQHQDALNDTINQLAEIVERANTITLAWASVIDVDALNDRANLPAEWMSVPDGTNFDQAIKTVQSPTFPKEATQLIQVFTENIQSHSGVLPNVFGGGAPTQTAEQSRNELNQALMQLGTTGEFMIQGWIGIHTNGIWELARNAPDMLDMNVLKGGAWHLEGEMGIPRSFAERKDELKALVMQNPVLAQALKVDAPVNSGAVRDYLDLPDLKDPNDDERMAVEDYINELLQGEPVQPPQPIAMPGQSPPPPQPPMPSSTTLLDLVNAGVLDPANTAELIREWALGPAGRKLYGTPGYQNVMAVMAQLKQMMAPPPPPPGAPPPNGPQGGPAGPPPSADTPNSKTPPQGTTPPQTGAAGPMVQ